MTTRRSKKTKHSKDFVRTPGLREAEIWVGKQGVTVPEIADTCISLLLNNRKTLEGFAAMQAIIHIDPPNEYWREADPANDTTYFYCPKAWWLKWQSRLEQVGWKFYHSKVILQ